ncbi:hypothetical protein S1OALGB6SA_2394 [Olavius algarvensis spirochete endosymbiont]|nr:hypothetical protein S1OALGB6SA_2394 [Olavius algarvensis spirochete endosymbiont]
MAYIEFVTLWNQLGGYEIEIVRMHSRQMWMEMYNSQNTFRGFLPFER